MNKKALIYLSKWLLILKGIGSYRNYFNILFAFLWLNTTFAVPLHKADVDERDKQTDASSSELAQPSDIRASDGEMAGKIIVKWSAVQFAKTYEVWRADSNLLASAVKIADTTASQHSDTNVLKNHTYYYWVRAIKDEFMSMFGGPDSGYTKPDAPQNVAASDGESPDYITVRWNHFDDNTSYEIWRGTNSNFKDAKKIGMSKDLFFIDKTADAGVIYYYFVRASSKLGVSDYSEPDIGYTLSPPLPPQGVRATSGAFADRIIIEWLTATNALYYTVWRGTNKNSLLMLATVAQPPYEDSQVREDVTYHYSVRAVNLAGSSLDSKIVSASCSKAAGLLPAPSGFSYAFSAKDMSLKLKWNSIDGAKGYSIRKGERNSFPYATNLISVGKNSFYQDKAVEAGKEYFYWIASVNSSGTGFYSSVLSVAIPPAVPQELKASKGDFMNVISLRWQKVRNASFYEVWRADEANFTKAQKIGTSIATYYEDYSVKPGDSFFYWVKASGSAGVSEPSIAEEGFTAISAPSWVDASDGELKGKVRVQWEPVIGAQYYEVWRSDNWQNSSAQRIAVLKKTDNFYFDTTVQPGKFYYYWIKAKSKHKYSNFSSYDIGHSPPKTPSVSSIPSRVFIAPVGVNASDGLYADSITIVWQPAYYAKKYEVLRSETDNLNSAIRIATVSARSFADFAIEPGVCYFYWVRALNVKGEARVSSCDAGFATLPVPSDCVGNSYDGGVLLKWKGVKNADLYEIWRSKGFSISSAEKITELFASFYQDNAAETGVRYYYWIRAKNALCKSAFSAALPIITPLGKPASIKTSYGDYSDKIMIYWLPVSNAVSYDVMRSLTKDITNAAIIGTANSTSFYDKSVEAGVRYYYWIRAKNQIASSPVSDVSIGMKRFSAPKNFSVSKGTDSNGIYLVWNAVSNADGYFVVRALTNDVSMIDSVFSTSNTNMLDTTVLAGQAYAYWIFATNSICVGESSLTNIGFRSLPAPVIYECSGGVYTDCVRLSWGAISNAELYEVWRAQTNMLSKANKIAVLKETAGNDFSVIAGAPYYYWVRASNSVGYGMFSSAVLGYKLLSPPNNITASDGTYIDRVEIKWNAVEGATAYEVWRAPFSEEDTNFNLLVVVKLPSYYDTNCLPFITNSYFVRAVSALCKSRCSPIERGFCSPATSLPAAPSFISASDGAYFDKISITWNAVRDASSYRIYRSDKFQQIISLIAIVNGNETSFDDFSCEPALPYLYYIASCNNVGVGLLSKPDEGYRAGNGAPASEVKSFTQVNNLNNLDFDGDGVSELVCFNKNSGELIIRSFSSSWAAVIPVGIRGRDFVILPGDYDGDGRNDIALYEQESGEWHILFSPMDGVENSVNFKWGGNGFIVVPPADFDGDGVNEIALYELQTERWYIKKMDGTMWIGGD